MFYDRNVLFCTLPQNLRYKVQSTVQVHVQVQGRTSLTYVKVWGMPVMEVAIISEPQTLLHAVTSPTTPACCSTNL